MKRTPASESSSSSSASASYSSAAAAEARQVAEARQAAAGAAPDEAAPAAGSSPAATVTGWRDGGGQEAVSVERRGDHSAVCRWSVAHFARAKARALWSRYFEVGGYDCRLLIYPKGDSQALPGYLSIYLQIVDPRGSSSSKWDCFASYRLSVVNHLDDSKSITRDSWHRFSSKKKSHGWCDFTPSSSILDPRTGFLSPSSDSLLITADILLLHESISFSRDSAASSALEPPASSPSTSADVLSGKFTWKVHNFSLFRDMIKSQKIMSPVFPAGDCNLRISVYQSSVAGADHLSMCLESKDTDKTLLPDRSCWCLFRMSVLSQRPAGTNHVHRDSYGRFAADNKAGDNTSLGWNDYMRMCDFLEHEAGYLVDDTAVFSTSFHVIKESSSFSKNPGVMLGVRAAARKSDGHFGKFTWRIENFTRLKDLLKKRKITGLCVKSRRFQIGNRDCRLIVYPRGQSQPPCHLSVFLEVTDSRNTSSDWSCFVSHRLSVVNQKMEDKSLTKESQNRYSKAAKDWGWREFVTLTSLFDQDSGFLVQDTVVFAAEVLILKETSIVQEFSDAETESSAQSGGASGSPGSQNDSISKRGSFTWRVENFLSFKEIMETRKIFSKFFQAGGCELRIGVYESFDTICIYLESEQSAGNDPDKNYWVRYRMAVVNQKNHAKTVWKESSICTKTWNNSVLQFMKVSDMLESDAGFLVRDTVIFVCEIIDFCPWFEFSDLEVLASEDDQDALSTDPDELIESEDSEGISGDEEDMFANFLSQAGLHLTYGDNPSQPLVTLREKLLMDAGAIAGFLTGLRVYLDDPAKVKRMLLPTKLSRGDGGKKDAPVGDANPPSLMNLLMGVKVLQQAIIDLLLDIMVECCQPSGGRNDYDSSEASSKPCSDSNGASTPLELSGYHEVIDYSPCHVYGRMEPVSNESTHTDVAQSSDPSMNGISDKDNPEQIIFPPEPSAGDLPADDGFLRITKTNWPEQSEELLGLIVNSLRTLDNVVPQGCPEPRRSPQAVQKIALVLDKAPKHLLPDLISLVPKLVDHSEHPLAAYALLECLQKPDAEPSLRISVLGALSQLEFGSEMWQHVLLQAFEILADSHDEPLVSAISFIFKAAAQCQHLPQAVRAVRSRLKSLGADVPSCVIDVLTKTVHTWTDVAEFYLREIDSDCELGGSCMATTCEYFTYGVNGLPPDGTGAGQDHVIHGCFHVSDVCVLIEMLSIPGLFADVSEVFERALLRGTIGLQSVAMVLEKRHSPVLAVLSRPDTADSHGKQISLDGNAPIQDDDFASILSLGGVLSVSRHPRVQDFVRMLYAIMFKIYSEEHYRLRMLKGLVDRAANNTLESCQGYDIDMDVLVFLVREEEGIARPVLNMMREVGQLAQVDRASLWHQLCATEDELIRSQEERKIELDKMTSEKTDLFQRLKESEAANSRLKIELKAEMDRFAREKRELSEQIIDVENQLEWTRSEKDEEIIKLSAERRVLQDRLHDAETQLAQLKSRKRDELKRVLKEKNVLAERLKSAEAARKRFDEELKRYATETVSREEVRQSLENEVRRLTETVGQTEGEKREKEAQVARCEAYIDGMEAKMQACQQYIQSLEASVQEEMTRHAPLYGVGLDVLSMQELETLARIHEDGLLKIRTIQQRKGSTNSLITDHSLSQLHGLYPAASTPTINLLTPPILPNGAGIHGNGHMNGTIGPWFSGS
ncbi:Ubiquitin carboxyl-terminal hydrolase 13 [Apostasia shenzhenica]|uniref:Ubiquitin carboxyl-terminal hydrolase 13 n=1 Tax=Apostasia shenzhenica TaxID=1088818 RepID=A0A2I0AQX5_9ASPA|nr:Ubiquitin carboxyl-terminal hydrolase 13 [Apostasia shenzhenica]